MLKIRKILFSNSKGFFTFFSNASFFVLYIIYFSINKNDFVLYKNIKEIGGRAVRFSETIDLKKKDYTIYGLLEILMIQF